MLIATPEKFDALLRFVPVLASQTKLIIIDEGHIIEPNDRRLRFEFFVHRLRSRLRPPLCRFVFISAVLPNATEFAEWITGSAENVVSSDWRPSRLMLGRLIWEGAVVRIVYTHQGDAPFNQDCFVPRFIEQLACTGVPGLGRRRRPFPADADEAHALAALRFSQEGTTLVFVPQQRSAESFGRTLLDALGTYRKLQPHGRGFDLPRPGRDSALWNRCRECIAAEIGADSILLRLLDEGILVHHGKLPWRVRVAMEDLARADAVRLIVATTTLAQGINLPIKTVLVRGLQMGHNQHVSPMTFWNICGRAGRAMRENEGQILFCLDLTSPLSQRLRQDENIRSVLATLHASRVLSALLQWLWSILDEWRRTHPEVDLAELCLHLAENRGGWTMPENHEFMSSLLDTLDGHLLALSEELSLNPANPDQVQEVLRSSLLAIQLRTNAVPGLTPADAGNMLNSRIQYIHRAHPNPVVRQRLYRLGMSLTSSQSIDEGCDLLLALFREAAAWFEWTQEQRTDLLYRASHFILQVRDTAPDSPLPAEWPNLFAAWLGGATVAEMTQDPVIARFTQDCSQLSAFLENVCGYLLPWGFNSILTYLTTVVAERGGELPAVCSYFSGMVKYGLHDPVAVCIVPYLDQDRKAARAAASVCPFDLAAPALIVHWTQAVSEEELTHLGLAASDAAAIVERRGWQRRPVRTWEQRRTDRVTLEVSAEVFQGVVSGMRLIIAPVPDVPSTFRVFSIAGDHFGHYSLRQGAIPDWWKQLDLVEAEVSSFERSATGSYEVVVSIVEI